MSPTEPRPASIWNRFWWPKSLLEQVPPAASAEEADAIARRNNLWLKTYMDLYILRWGALWAASLMVMLLLVVFSQRGFGDPVNRHDILTGSRSDGHPGRARCR
jgi:hypothetical protein